MLLVLLFCVFVFALVKIAYDKVEAVGFYENQLYDQELKYNLFDSKQIEAQAIYVYDFDSSLEIYSRNGDEKKGIASLTKLMTAFVAPKVCPNKILVTSDMLPHADSVPFSSGQVWHRDDLIKAMLVASSNNAAEILNKSTSTDSNSIVPTMNEYAKKLGLLDSMFVNPTGLDENDVIVTNISTAKDITKLGYYTYKKLDKIAEASSQKEITIEDTKNDKITIHNTNEIIEKIRNIRLSKTGYTDQAGGNLLILYKSIINDHVIGITVLGSSKEGRFDDMSKMILSTERYLQAKQNKELVEDGTS